MQWYIPLPGYSHCVLIEGKRRSIQMRRRGEEEEVNVDGEGGMEEGENGR